MYTYLRAFIVWCKIFAKLERICVYSLKIVEFSNPTKTQRTQCGYIVAYILLLYTGWKDIGSLPITQGKNTAIFHMGNSTGNGAF